MSSDRSSTSRLRLVGYYAGSYLDGIVILHGTDKGGFLRFAWLSQSLRDVGYVFLTVTLVAGATSITACFYGLRASGGPAGVGDVVAQAVKVNLVIANVIGLFTVMLFYGAGLPIGG